MENNRKGNIGNKETLQALPYRDNRPGAPGRTVDPEYRSGKICVNPPIIVSVQIYRAPCGELLLGCCRDKLCLCDWPAEKHHDRVIRRLSRMLHARFEEGTSQILGRAARQLDEYFAGRRKEFDIPLLFTGTEFQKAVWSELLKVPYGATISYAGLANRLGVPKAVRAVANASGANSISIFAPCHRIIGSDLSLTGYAGGVEAKKFLLKLESEQEM